MAKVPSRSQRQGKKVATIRSGEIYLCCFDPTVGHEINGLEVRSAIRLDQIRTIDCQRLIRSLGMIDSSTMNRVDEAIKISLGLMDF